LKSSFTISPPSEPKRRTYTTSAYFFAFIGLGMVGALLGPSLPYLAEITRTSLSQISILFIARSLGYLGGSIMGGYLFDRFSGHVLMAITLLALGITVWLTPSVSLLWILTGLLFLTGLSQGIVDVGGNTLIVWLYGKKVGPYMNALHMFYGVGTFLAPIILAQAVLVTGKINWGYWLIGGLVLLPALQLSSIPSQAIRSSAAADSGKRSNNLLVALAALFLFCYSSFANIFGGWVFTYVTLLGLTSETNAAYLTSTFWGAFTVGRLISIPVAMHVRPSRILLADLLGCLLSTGIMILLPNSIPAIWIGAAGLGLFAASLFPTTVSLVEQRIEITGNITSWFVIGSALGGMIPPWIVGQFIEQSAPQIMLYSVLMALLVGCAVYYFLNLEPVSGAAVNKA
jgi:FHS family Na+ dependent glucose MFS transporter 1